MAGLVYYSGKRRVLPQLERTTAYIDTLNITNKKSEYQKHGWMLPIINLKDDDLASKLVEWKKTKNFNLAGDILSQAIILNKTEEVAVVKKHLLSNFPSDIILSWLYENKTNIMTNDDRIRHNHKKLLLEPKDSLTWTDQAINYIIVNNRDESIKCIEEALKINSNLGFIIRNASRIFSLIGDNGRSIKLLKNSEYYRFDPQILSAEIAFSQLENRKTTGIELGHKLLSNMNYQNHEKSELASSLGTIEFFKGEFKKSETLFNLSLLVHNKNSFAQSLWYKKDVISTQTFKDYEDSNEIQTHRYLKQNNFVASLRYALNWKEEEPYSLRPYTVASQLSGVLLGDFEKAYELVKQGMETQKEIKGDNYTVKDELGFANDMAYYLLKSDKIIEAEKYLKPSLEIKNKATKLDDCEYANIATLGLLAYKQNNADLGRQLYRKTIKHFSDEGKSYLVGSAFLNFFDEEIKVLHDIVSLENLKKELDDIIPNDVQNDLAFRKTNSLKLFNETVKHFQ